MITSIRLYVVTGRSLVNTWRTAQQQLSRWPLKETRGWTPAGSSWARWRPATPSSAAAWWWPPFETLVNCPRKATHWPRRRQCSRLVQRGADRCRHCCGAMSPSRPARQDAGRRSSRWRLSSWPSVQPAETNRASTQVLFVYIDIMTTPPRAAWVLTCMTALTLWAPETVRSASAHVEPVGITLFKVIQGHRI